MKINEYEIISIIFLCKLFITFLNEYALSAGREGQIVASFAWDINLNILVSTMFFAIPLTILYNGLKLDVLIEYENDDDRAQGE